MKAFKAPETSLGNLDAESAATLIAAATDVALILDRRGVIRDLAFNSEDLALQMESGRSLLGEPWVETVAQDSRAKVDALLRDVTTKTAPRWRHINHLAVGGESIPILYSALQVGEEGSTVAFGRDLRAISALQQRLVDAQQSMERDYSRLRHVETRYRLLFQMSSEAVLIVDGFTQKLLEANPAAGQLFGEAAGRYIGRPFAEVFDAESAPVMLGLLASTRASGRAEDVRVRLADGKREVMMSASVFRQESASLLLVRLLPLLHQAPAASMSPLSEKLLKVVESAPDGFVVTGHDGKILIANAAFLDMAQLASEEQALGETLDRWLGRPGVDLDVLTANLRQRGSVRLFATTLRGEFGTSAEVEISAVSVRNGGQPCYGFAIRNVGPRLSPDSRVGRELPRSVEQLTELIGRVSLKDLVRESTDMIERLCIVAALELTGDNRASAAEMLGLSRQSLYVKLRRYGLGDLAEESRN